MRPVKAKIPKHWHRQYKNNDIGHDIDDPVYSDNFWEINAFGLNIRCPVRINGDALENICEYLCHGICKNKNTNYN